MIKCSYTVHITYEKYLFKKHKKGGCNCSKWKLYKRAKKKEKTRYKSFIEIWEEFQLYWKMSFPSKVCLVLSLQRVHIKHKGIDLQISSLVCFPKYPFQHDQWSTTEPGITQLSPKRLSPTVHISRAIEQWRNTYNTNPSELCHVSINYQLEFSPKLWSKWRMQSPGGAFTLHMLL